MSQESAQIQPILADTAEQDRRVWVRRVRPLKSYCQRGPGEPDDVWWIGQIRDISRSGIGLYMQHHFELETVLTVELENSARKHFRTVQVRVVHATPQPGGFWLMGCAFSQEISEADLEGLL
jgi:hypothetical protein